MGFLPISFRRLFSRGNRIERHTGRELAHGKQLGSFPGRSVLGSDEVIEWR